MLESVVERRLCREVARLSGEAIKLYFKDWPDRLVLLPFGAHCFVETKAPGRKPRPMQLRNHARLRRLGHVVLVEDGSTWSETLAAMQRLVTIAIAASGGRITKERGHARQEASRPARPSLSVSRR